MSEAGAIRNRLQQGGPVTRGEELFTRRTGGEAGQESMSITDRQTGRAARFGFGEFRSPGTAAAPAAAPAGGTAGAAPPSDRVIGEARGRQVAVAARRRADGAVEERESLLSTRRGGARRRLLG